ncbi:clathrin heavy chain linker domain-containing protein 1 isoform X1 [Tachysurus ichikawai]
MDFNAQDAPLCESTRDRNFMKSLKEFIKSEKEQLCCPDEGPDEQRYTIYSTAFHKIIDYATAYKPILTAIKKEYDDFIASVNYDQHQAQLAHGKLKAMLAQPTSFMYYQRRADQLQERIATIQRNTADLHSEMKRFQESKNKREVSRQQETLQLPAPVGPIPGLTLSELLNPESLDKHLEHLEEKRNELLSKKQSQYVPVQVQNELEVKIKAILNQKDELSVENNKLLLRYKQLTYLKETLSRWEKSGSHPPVLELLSSERKHVSEIKVSEDEHVGFQDGSSEQDDPGKIKESKRLADYVERFVKLFESSDYETAAFHAATSPHGVLRNINVLEKFKAISVYKEAVHPVLLFFRFLMVSAPAGKPLPEKLSLEGVRCALKHGYVELLTFAVSQHRLTYTEELGDLICSHRHDDPRVVDTCLALAQIVYSACGVRRKAALSMCKRGLTGAALEFIYYNKEFTVEDCVFVLKELPCVELLQDFTQPGDGTPPLMSVGFICCYLLNSELEDLVFQLLEQIQARGQGALEETILEDEMCSVESWSEIAARCEQTGRLLLAQDITSTLLLQDGVMRLSPGLDGAELMDHVFM